MRRGAASALRDFLRHEAAGGIVLIAAAAAAMAAANLPATAGGYAAWLHWRTGPVLAPALGPMTVHLWINDGLMAVFFLLVGLEIKREFAGGELAGRQRRRLPFVAAAAGMIVPAAVYLAVVAGSPGLARGWAIPAATDIAFAVGMVALLGRRVPPALRIFLTAVAIVDDMGAVAIIALGYTARVDWGALAAAAGVVAVLAALNRHGERRLWPYIAGFALMWWLLMLSGVHATIAGVATAMLVPGESPGKTSPGKTPPSRRGGDTPLARLEHALNPWVAFAVVPVFAFANAGVAIPAGGLAALAQPLVIAIAAGLFVGKQAGVLGAVWIAERTGFARRPAGAGWAQLYGVALLAGIGFTMSLFIGELAFPGDPVLGAQVKLGVLLGSVAAAVAGYGVLRLAPVRRAG